jgi:hypothetical protein
MTFTSNELAIIDKWEARLKSNGIIFSRKNPGNVDLVLGFVKNQLGGVISEVNLDAATKATWAALVFEPGYEMPDPRATEKAKAKADAEELIRARKRDALARAGINIQPKSTELDREDPAREKAERAAAEKEAFEIAQAQAKEAYERLIWAPVTRAGRTDHAATATQREYFKQLKVTRGDGVISWTEMFRLAKEYLDGVDREQEQMRW